MKVLLDHGATQLPVCRGVLIDPQVVRPLPGGASHNRRRRGLSACSCVCSSHTTCPPPCTSSCLWLPACSHMLLAQLSQPLTRVQTLTQQAFVLLFECLGLCH